MSVSTFENKKDALGMVHALFRQKSAQDAVDYCLENLEQSAADEDAYQWWDGVLCSIVAFARASGETVKAPSPADHKPNRFDHLSVTPSVATSIARRRRQAAATEFGSVRPRRTTVLRIVN